MTQQQCQHVWIYENTVYEEKDTLNIIILHRKCSRCDAAELQIEMPDAVITTYDELKQIL